MRLTILIVMLASSLAGFAQFGITVNGNYSIMGSYTTTVGSTNLSDLTGFSQLVQSYTLKESYESRGGYGVGLTYDKSFASKFELRTGLDYSSISYKRNTEVIYEPLVVTDSDLILGSLEGIPIFRSSNVEPSQLSFLDYSNIGETTVSYLSIPILINFSFTDKVKIGLGVKNSFLLAAKERQFQYNVGLNGPIITEVDNKSKEGFKTYNLIGSLLINYSLTDKWSLETSCNQGLTGIYEDEKQVAGDAKMRNVTLGINYRL